MGSGLTEVLQLAWQTHYLPTVLSPHPPLLLRLTDKQGSPRVLFALKAWSNDFFLKKILSTEYQTCHAPEHMTVHQHTLPQTIPDGTTQD